MPLKVLHVCRGMANSSGTTHIVGPLAAEQARLGCAVSLFCVEKGRSPPVLPDPGLVESRCFRQTLPLNNPGLSRSFATTLWKRISEFDVVHVHAIWNFPSWWTMRSAARARIPYIVAPQGSLDAWALKQNRWGKLVYGRMTEVPLMRRAAGIQALTEKEAAQIRAFGIDAPGRVIPNGIDARQLRNGRSPDPEYFGLSADCRTILFLSRVHPKKGLDILLAAATLAAGRVPELRFIVAGGDAGSGYLENVKGECRRQGLAGRFVFLDEVRNDRKYRVLAAADAFVLPSYSEGLPVAVLEALGCGLPVVVSEECNLPEVEQKGAGYVVPVDAARFAAALERLFSAPVEERKRMGEQGRNLVAEGFTWPEIAKRTIEWYEQLTAARTIH